MDEENIVVNIYLFEDSGVITIKNLDICKIGEIKDDVLLKKLKDVVQKQLDQ